MAIVREYKYGGATIRIHDDAYAHLTPEEMAEKRQAMLKRAGELYWECVAERERRMQNDNQSLSTAS
jgi:hypothetical protein